jgi:hypothetical protein
MTDNLGGKVKGFNDVYSTLMGALRAANGLVTDRRNNRHQDEPPTVYNEQLQDIEDARQYLIRNKPL